MNTSTLDRPPAAYASGRTLTVAIAVALVLEAGLGLLLLDRPSQPVARPVAPPHVMHIVTIADLPPPPPPPQPQPQPTPPVVPPVHHEVQHAAPHQPRPAPEPPRTTQPVPAPEPTPAPPAPATPATPPPAQPAPTPPAATPVVNRQAVRRGVVPVTRVDPDYPPRALASNTEGSVVADLTIEPDGHVSDVRIVRAQPPGLFEHAAEKALRQWKFSAGDSGIVGEVELNFTLN